MIIYLYRSCIFFVLLLLRLPVLPKVTIGEEAIQRLVHLIFLIIAFSPFFRFLEWLFLILSLCCHWQSNSSGVISSEYIEADDKVSIKIDVLGFIQLCSTGNPPYWSAFFADRTLPPPPGGGDGTRSLVNVAFKWKINPRDFKLCAVALVSVYKK